jgi:hypothetical protein
MLQQSLESGCELDDVVLVYCLNDIADIVPQWQAINDRIYAKLLVPPEKRNFFVENSWLINTLYFRWYALNDPDASNYYYFVRAAYDGSLWLKQQARLRRFRDLVESHGGRFLVVTFPFLHDLGPDYEYRDVHRQLAEFWSSLGVPHLDLLDTFTSERPQDIVVNAFDAHPNEKAHAMAAQAILKFLDAHRNGE